jgi:hypothetical protein
MHRRIGIPLTRFLVLTALVATIGCDDEATNIAREASDRQAAQNRQMAELQREVARGSHELVKSDAAAREKILAVHRDLQEERQQLGESWNDLESERQQVDRRRRSDSVWQALVTIILGSLVIAAFFRFLWQLLAHGNEPLDAEITELLVEHLLPEMPQELGNAECSQAALPREVTESAALPHPKAPTHPQERNSE